MGSSPWLCGVDATLRTPPRRVPGELCYAGYTSWRSIAPLDTAGLVGGETLGRGQRFGPVPITTTACMVRHSQRIRGATRDAGCRKNKAADVYNAWHQPIPAIIDVTDAGAIVRNEYYDRDPVDRWGSGRVTLLGDAAPAQRW